MKRLHQKLRPFNILDTAIVVVVVAFDLMLWNEAVSGMFHSEWIHWQVQGMRPRIILQNLIRNNVLLNLTYPMLAPWSVGLLIISLRHPRPRYTILWKGPGFVSIAVSSIFMAWNWLFKLVFVLHKDIYAKSFFERTDKTYTLMLPLSNAPQVGSAVAASWIVLAISGRWKSDGGMDRSVRHSPGSSLVGNLCGRVVGTICPLNRVSNRSVKSGFGNKSSWGHRSRLRYFRRLGFVAQFYADQSRPIPRSRLFMERPDPANRPVLVLDFGSQYVQLIARRVRERHAFARIVRHDITAERVTES